MESAISNANAASASKGSGEPDGSASDSPVSNNEEPSLEQQNRELLRMSRYRSLFLARLAHELRTPLTSILGFSEILLNQEKLTDPQRSFCERIQSSAHQMQNSLNQLSDLARLEVGQTQLATEELSLTEVLQDSLSAAARGAQKKRVLVNCEVKEDLTSFYSDRGRLRQVVYNVLAYAIMRSPEKETVELRAQINHDVVEILIRDKGDTLANPLEIGMLEADNDNAGTGELGLAIACQNLQILGGAISAANTDAGLEIKISLPLNPHRDAK